MLPLTLLPLLIASPASETPPPVTLRPFEEEESDKGWKGSITAGAIITTGNSKTKNATVTADSNWKGEDNAFSAEFLWNFQGDDDGVTQRRVYGKLQFDHYYTPQTYSYANASAGHDFSADLDLRWTTGLGLGHEFLKESTWEFSGEAGLSYVDESFKTDPLNPPAVDPDTNYLAARLAYATKYTPNKTWEFYHLGEVFPSLEDGDDIYARLDTGAKTNLTESIYLQAQWVFDWDNTPAPDNGRKSSLFAVTVGWSF